MYVDNLLNQKMEKLESKLFEAAAKGCIRSLQKLLKDDQLILDRAVVNCFSENPLHVAAMLGHIDFVNEIIRIKPQLTIELNSQQASPLHFASAKGHVDVVRALLSFDSRTCLTRDKNGLTPLHLAAVKGRVEVMMMLLQAQPDAARITACTGENILHLCVKHYQLDAMKLLLNTIDDHEFINSRDTNGNTVLHLAVADKQVETINFLLTVATLEVNALNLEGMTAVDVLIRSRKDVRDSFIKDSLKHAGGFGIMETNISLNTNQNMATRAWAPHPYHPTSSTSVQNNNLVEKQRNWLEKKRDALMVVASLIATMAFQVGVNPPSGVWQDDEKDSPDPHEAGYAIMERNWPGRYVVFYIVNTIGFIASLSIILLLMSGLPLRRRFFMWILMVMVWVAISATALTYLVSVIVLTPSDKASVLFAMKLSIAVWNGLMALLLISHTIRMVEKAVKKLGKTSGMVIKGSAIVENNISL